MAIRIIYAILLLSILTPFARSEEQVYILRKPKPEKEEVRSIYINEERGFGFDLREGFSFSVAEPEEDVFNLIIELDGYPLSGILTIEILEEELSSLGYWRLMQERDPSIEENLAYERQVDLAGVSGVQVRIEGSNQGSHFLILSLVFTSGPNGYILSCFADSHFFNKVPDFLEEISEGFYFVEEDIGEEENEGDEEASGEEPSNEEETTTPEEEPPGET